MLVYIMRHGPAEDRAPSGRDRDRRLTYDGRAVVERSAQQLRASRAAPVTLVLSSPFARAVETAEIVCAEACAPGTRIVLREELASEEPPAVELVAELARGGVDAILVGHQPAAEILVRELCRGAAGLRSMRTATIAAMRWHERRWALAGVIDPPR